METELSELKESAAAAGAAAEKAAADASVRRKRFLAVLVSRCCAKHLWIESNEKAGMNLLLQNFGSLTRLRFRRTGGGRFAEIRGGLPHPADRGPHSESRGGGGAGCEGGGGGCGAEGGGGRAGTGGARHTDGEDSSSDITHYAILT